MATSQFAAPMLPPAMQEGDNNANPLAGGLVYVYVAGTTTPDASYPTYANALAGTTPNANPVVLDANGRAQIWLQAERRYKIVVKDSTGAVTYQTMDDYSPGQGYPGSFLSEWVLFQAAPVAFVSGNSFKVTGYDASLILSSSRRVKCQVTAGTVYGTISRVTFATDTTVTVALDSGALDAGLSAVYFGLVSGPGSPSVAPSHRDRCSHVKAHRATSVQALTLATWNKIQFNGETVDKLGEFDSVTNFRFTPLYQAAVYDDPPRYLMMAQITFTTSIVSAQIAVYRDGVAINVRTQNMGIANGTICIDWTEEQQVGTGHYYEIFVNPSANVNVDFDPDTTWFHILRIQ